MKNEKMIRKQEMRLLHNRHKVIQRILGREKNQKIGAMKNER